MQHARRALARMSLLLAASRAEDAGSSIDSFSEAMLEDEQYLEAYDDDLESLRRELEAITAITWRSGR